MSRDFMDRNERFDRHLAKMEAPEKSPLYRAYRAERNSGKTHAQIVEDGIFGSLANEFALKYSEEIAVYVDAMNKRGERDSIGDQDPYGRPLKGQP